MDGDFQRRNNSACPEASLGARERNGSPCSNPVRYFPFRLTPDAFDAGSFRIIQTSPGATAGSVRRIELPDFRLSYFEIDFSCITNVGLDPEFMSFTVPTCIKDFQKFNGHCLAETSLYLHPTTEILGSGGPRKSFTGEISWKYLLESIAALQGVDIDDALLPMKSLEIPLLGIKRLQARLGEAFNLVEELSKNSASGSEFSHFSKEIRETVIDFIICASPKARHKTSVRRCPSHIVRTAEDYFAEHIDQPISLIDLCRAAQVSAGTLTSAFRSVTGMTPARYFKIRRLNEAHGLLSKKVFERSPVKRAALSVGLTDLGRFSIEYRQLFGNSPSVVSA